MQTRFMNMLGEAINSLASFEFRISFIYRHYRHCIKFVFCRFVGPEVLRVREVRQRRDREAANLSEGEGRKLRHRDHQGAEAGARG